MLQMPDAAVCPCAQENLKHTLPVDVYDLIPDSSIDLRIGYQAQQLDWLSQQRVLEAALQNPATEDRAATISYLPVRPCCFLAGMAARAPRATLEVLHACP